MRSLVIFIGLLVMSLGIGVGGFVVTHQPGRNELQLARLFFVIAAIGGAAASVAQALSVPDNSTLVDILVGLAGAVICGSLYVVLVWIKHKINESKPKLSK